MRAPGRATLGDGSQIRVDDALDPGDLLDLPVDPRQPEEPPRRLNAKRGVSLGEVVALHPHAHPWSIRHTGALPPCGPVLVVLRLRDLLLTGEEVGLCGDPEEPELATHAYAGILIDGALTFVPWAKELIGRSKDAYDRALKEAGGQDVLPWAARRKAMAVAEDRGKEIWPN